MLQLKGIRKVFNAGTADEKIAIADIDLSMNKGEFLTIIGSNGAGKTTLLDLITGTCQADKGAAPLLTYKVDMKVLVAKEQGKADPFFRVRASINRNVFKEGDQIELHVTPTKDAYITVFNILEDQTVLISIDRNWEEG